AFSFLVEPLHLRYQPFKRLADLFPVAANLDLDWRLTRPEVKRALKIVRQIRKRYFFVNAKMFHQRPLQFFVIGLHPLRPSSPRCNHASAIDFSGSEIINSGSTTNCVPNPWHAGQAPKWLLKEKCFGVSSPNVKPLSAFP